MAWNGKWFGSGVAIRITLEDGADWYGFFRRTGKYRIGSRQVQCLVFSVTKDGALITAPFRIIHLVVKHDLDAAEARPIRPQPKFVPKRVLKRKAA